MCNLCNPVYTAVVYFIVYTVDIFYLLYQIHVKNRKIIQIHYQINLSSRPPKIYSTVKLRSENTNTSKRKVELGVRSEMIDLNSFQGIFAFFPKK